MHHRNPWHDLDITETDEDDGHSSSRGHDCMDENVQATRLVYAHHRHRIMGSQKKQGLFSSSKLQNNILFSSFTASILLLGGVVLAFVTFQSIVSLINRPHHALWSESFLKHYALYESLYNSRGTTSQYTNKGTNQKEFFDKKKILLETYSDAIDHCEMTIVFLEPRLGDPSYSRSESAWFALESAAYAFPEACVHLIVTSPSCISPLKKSPIFMEEIRSNIYHKSLPVFRKTMIESGRVRLSTWNIPKYGWNDCSIVLANPSRALMNIHFWTEEFIDTIENDWVLIMQNDSIWCSTEDILHDVLAQWDSYAYVGPPWPIAAANNDKGKSLPSKKMCNEFSKRWNTWLQNPLQPKRSSPEQKQRRNKGSLPDKEFIFESHFPDLCEFQKGPGAVGRGGLSLRSRQWMIRAIEACPHVLYSGTDVSSKNNACQVADENIDEDFYFSVVLQGIRAPLPHAVKASLFALESVWPEDAAQLYGDPDKDVSSGGSQHLYSHPLINAGKRHVTVPYGIYKAWDYIPESILHTGEVNDVCPFLKYAQIKR